MSKNKRGWGGGIWDQMYKLHFPLTVESFSFVCSCNSARASNMHPLAAIILVVKGNIPCFLMIFFLFHAFMTLTPGKSEGGEERRTQSNMDQVKNEW